MHDYNLGDKDNIDIKENLDKLWEAIQASDSKKIEQIWQKLEHQLSILLGTIAVHRSKKRCFAEISDK